MAEHCPVCEKPYSPSRPKQKYRQVCAECYRAMRRDEYRLTKSKPAGRAGRGPQKMSTRSLVGKAVQRREQIIQQYAADVAKGRPIRFVRGYLEGLGAEKG